MTKAEVINDIMYDLQFKDTASFEADSKSYDIARENGVWVITGNGERYECKGKADVRKQVARLGAIIVQM